MTPTTRALELADTIRRGLRHIEEALSHGGAFDPTTTDLTVRVMTTDYAAVTLMPTLLAKLARDAPNLKVAIRTMNPSRWREDLESGESHLVIGYFHDLPDGSYSSVILTDTIACVARCGHPAIRSGISLNAYAEARHAYLAGTHHGDVTTVEQATDTALAELGLARIISFSVANVLVIMPVVAQTDLIATLPVGAAQQVCTQFQLQAVPLPFVVPDLKISLIWHEREHRDAAHFWFREAVRDVSRQHQAGAKSSSGGPRTPRTAIEGGRTR